MRQKNIARMAIVLTVVLLTAGCLGFGGSSGPQTTEEGLTSGEVAERAIVSMSNVDSYTYESELDVRNSYEDIRNNETIASSEEQFSSSAVITHNGAEYLSEHNLTTNGETRERGYYTDGEENYSRVSGNWGYDTDAPDRYYTGLYSEFNWSNASLEESDSTVTLTISGDDVDHTVFTENVFEVDSKVINGDVETVSQNATVTMTVDKNDRYVQELTVDMEYEQENDNPTQSTVDRDMEMTIVYSDHGTTTVASPALLI